MKKFKITNVKTIFRTDKPVIVFELANGEAILRSPKLALIDLQNSFRALKLPNNCLDNGIAYAHPAQLETFMLSLNACVGADLTGDIINVKEGDAYVDQQGTTKFITKAGLRVSSGFLSIPFTQAEIMRRELAEAGATTMMSMFGFGTAPSMSMPALPATPVTHEEYEGEEGGNLDFKTSEEAFGKKETPKAKA
jgi:hypothetical protein